MISWWKSSQERTTHKRVSELIRRACQQTYTPSSDITIDEAMVAFKGRSKDTIKIKNKPIDTDYKLWCIRVWPWYGKIQALYLLGRMPRFVRKLPYSAEVRIRNYTGDSEKFSWIGLDRLSRTTYFVASDKELVNRACHNYGVQQVEVCGFWFNYTLLPSGCGWHSVWVTWPLRWPQHYI